MRQHSKLTGHLRCPHALTRNLTDSSPSGLDSLRFRSRKWEKALALAVSLWIVGGSVAGAAEMTTVSLDAKGLDVSWQNADGVTEAEKGTADTPFPRTPGNKTLLIGGTWNKPTNHSGYNFFAGNGADDDAYNSFGGYTLNVNGAYFQNTTQTSPLMNLAGAFLKGSASLQNNAVIFSNSIFGYWNSDSNAPVVIAGAKTDAIG